MPIFFQGIKSLSETPFLPPSAFEKRDILEQARNGSLCMPPHSVLLLRF